MRVSRSQHVRAVLSLVSAIVNHGVVWLYMLVAFQDIDVIAGGSRKVGVMLGAVP